MKKIPLIIITILLATGLAFSAVSHLTILHINDSHGHAWPFNEYNNPEIGGFASLATLIEQIRNEVTRQGGHLLVLHAGDINTGVPESDQLNAIPDIVAMNMIGFDAMTFGNHEFDKPRAELLAELKYMNFPVVSANIFNKDHKNPVQPYIIKDYGDLKVAVLGLTTEETAILQPIYLGDWHLENAVESAKKIMPEMKQNADIVVAVTHLGYLDIPISAITTSISLARANIGIDVIVDGHTHTVFQEAPVINNTIIVQAGEWTKYLGRLDLTINDGKVINHKWKLIPVNLKKIVATEASGKPLFDFVESYIPPEPKVKAAMDFFYEFGSQKLDLVIGESRIFFDGDRVNTYSKDTNLTNLIADSMKWKTKADIAFINGGGIRSSIQPGKITYRNILMSLPFGNTLYVFNLKGDEIMKILEYAVTIPPGKGGYIHPSGLLFISQNGKIKEVKINNKPIDLNKSYKVTVNSYFVAGGDGYSMFKEWKSKGYDTGFTDADVLREYIASLSPIKYYDDKIRFFRK